MVCEYDLTCLRPGEASSIKVRGVDITNIIKEELMWCKMTNKLVDHDQCVKNMIFRPEYKYKYVFVDIFGRQQYEYN